uniref:Uncharacterized protein n=1 Tax=Myoviridae sp. ctpKu3 TaxID=2825175 RepID=A0A8S5UVT2_9CAUD|nr:MAG TPA: hypothetical protein [Myoviridae sp. ctpKu3]
MVSPLVALHLCTRGFFYLIPPSLQGSTHETKSIHKIY